MKKEKNKKEKKDKKVGYFKSLRQEMKKVTWPDKKDLLKYSLATLFLCIIVVAFFQLLDLGLSFVKGVFN